MGFLIGFLTFIMVVDCLVLILLVIVQLPKKDAGAGMAFGGGAADALFGAGSGTVLTKITKYAAGIMFGLALVLTVMQSSYAHRSVSEFERSVAQPAPQPASAPAPVTQAEPPANTPTPEAPAATGSKVNLPTVSPANTNAPTDAPVNK
jgi:preprotein translocase subunit SecG